MEKRANGRACACAPSEASAELWGSKRPVCEWALENRSLDLCEVQRAKNRTRATPANEGGRKNISPRARRPTPSDGLPFRAAHRRPSPRPTTPARRMVTIKYKAKTIHSAPGTVKDVKCTLALATGLLPGEMKLIRKGKVLADPEEAVAAEEKLMLLRQGRSTPRRARRSASTSARSSGAATHSAPLRRPPRERHGPLDRPHCRGAPPAAVRRVHRGAAVPAARRRADAPRPRPPRLPRPPTNAVTIFAVPCPINPQAALQARADEHAALVQAAEESLRAALHRDVTGGSADAADADSAGAGDGASDAARGADSSRRPRALATLESALVDAPPRGPPPAPRMGGGLASRVREMGEDEALLEPLLRLPPSLVEAAAELDLDLGDASAAAAAAAAIESSAASSVYTVGSSSSSSCASSSSSSCPPRAPPPPPPEAYGVPSRLRAGLMPAHDEAPPPGATLVEIDLSQLGEEGADAALALLRADRARSARSARRRTRCRSTSGRRSPRTRRRASRSGVRAGRAAQCGADSAHLAAVGPIAAAAAAAASAHAVPAAWWCRCQRRRRPPLSSARRSA